MFEIKVLICGQWMLYKRVDSYDEARVLCDWCNSKYLDNVFALLEV